MADKPERQNNIGILGEKTYHFALRIIKAYTYLRSKKVVILSNQLLRSGTAIGANCREAIYAQSKADFISKLSISLKEASETAYWLELLNDSHYIENKSFESVYGDCIEIIKLLTSIISTTKDKYLSNNSSNDSQNSNIKGNNHNYPLPC